MSENDNQIEETHGKDFSENPDSNAFDDANYVYTPESDKAEIPNANRCLAHLNKVMYGQNEAKRAITMALQSSRYKYNNPVLDIPTSRLLIIGPLGSGRTLLLKSLAEYSGLPFVKIHLGTSVGESLMQSAFLEISQQLWDIDKEKFKTNSHLAIVYFDGLEHIINPGSVFLLKEDPYIKLQNEFIEIQTKDYGLNLGQLELKNMTFITSATLKGIEDIVMERLTGSKVGFNSKSNIHIEKSHAHKYITSEDLLDYGLSYSLVNSFTRITYCSNLTRDDFFSILSRKDSYLNVMIGLLKKEDGISIAVSPNAKWELSDYLVKCGSNLRGIPPAVDKVIMPYLFHPGKYVRSAVKNGVNQLTAEIMKERLYDHNSEINLNGKDKG